MGTTSLHIALTSPGVHRVDLTSSPVNGIKLTTPIVTNSAKVTVDTTDGWAVRTNYVPRVGEIIVYSDRRVVGEMNYPGIKIGDGNAFVVDLPFVGDDVTDVITEALNTHLMDNVRHITDEERTYWNNKLDWKMDDETLTLAPSAF